MCLACFVQNNVFMIIFIHVIAWYPLFILSDFISEQYSIIMRNARLDDHKLESKLQGETSTTLDIQMISLCWQKVKRN